MLASATSNGFSSRGLSPAQRGLWRSQSPVRPKMTKPKKIQIRTDSKQNRTGKSYYFFFVLVDGSLSCLPLMAESSSHLIPASFFYLSRFVWCAPSAFIDFLLLPMPTEYNTNYDAWLLLWACDWYNAVII